MLARRLPGLLFCLDAAQTIGIETLRGVVRDVALLGQLEPLAGAVDAARATA